MPFDRELIFGDPEDLNINHHHHHHLSNNQFDLLNHSNNLQHQLDLTLPTPPRSPRQHNKNSTFDMNMMGGGGGGGLGPTIPDSVMDDLFNLLGEENNDNNNSAGGGAASLALDDLFGGFSSSGGGMGGRKRKISDSWFNLSDHDHHELFGQIAENFSSLSGGIGGNLAASPSSSSSNSSNCSPQQQLNNHLNNSLKFNELDGPSSLLDSLMSSTYSPPPTQPPSPMSTPCKNRNNGGGPPLSPCSTVIKSEPPTQPGSIVSELDDYQSGVVDDDVDLAVGVYGTGDAADFLADFDNFDSFEKLAFCDDEDEDQVEGEEEEDYKPMMKRSKFDSESSTDDNYFLKKENSSCGGGSLDQIMWNCSSSTAGFIKEEKIEVEQVPHDDDAAMLLHDNEEEEEEEELFNSEEHQRLISLRAAFNNDHSYACVVSSSCSDDNDDFADKKVLIEATTTTAAASAAAVSTSAASLSTSTMLNFDKMGIKKTKILVPLKDLMESLQQKSYLVSPLGPGKKIITLTNGETVKGVLTSCPAAKSLASSPSSKPSNHNVRKRPHHPLKFANPPRLLLSGDELELGEDSSSCSTTMTTGSSLGLQNGHHHSNHHNHHHSNNSNCIDSSSSSSPSSSKKKTKAHNNMERMRRIDLRNSFDNLKKLVPVLSKSPKCSKVEILKKAEEYIRGLRGLEKKLQKEEQQLRLKLQQNKLRQEQAVAEQQLSCA